MGVPGQKSHTDNTHPPKSSTTGARCRALTSSSRRQHAESRKGQSLAGWNCQNR